MCWAGRALRWRGAAEEGVLARPERPSRWTLPITAFRVTFPSSAAIWLADNPASHSFFNCSTRSSDHVNTVIAFFPSLAPADFGVALRCQSSQKSLPAESLSPRRARKARPNVYAEQKRLKGSVLPTEISYPTGKKLQYGVTPAQESARVRPHVPSPKHCNALFPRHRRYTGAACPGLL